MKAVSQQNLSTQNRPANRKENCRDVLDDAKLP